MFYSIYSTRDNLQQWECVIHYSNGSVCKKMQVLIVLDIHLKHWSFPIMWFKKKKSKRTIKKKTEQNLHYIWVFILDKNISYLEGSQRSTTSVTSFLKLSQQRNNWSRTQGDCLAAVLAGVSIWAKGELRRTLCCGRHSRTAAPRRPRCLWTPPGSDGGFCRWGGASSGSFRSCCGWWASQGGPSPAWRPHCRARLEAIMATRYTQSLHFKAWAFNI